MKEFQNNTVLIATSYHLDVRGMECVIHELARIDSAGAVNCSEDLFEIMKLKPVRCILMDFTSPGFAVDNIQKLSKLYPRTSVIAYTADVGARAMGDAIKAGVHGYVKRDCDLEEIKDCITSVVNGERFFCNQVLTKVNQTLLGESVSNTCAGIELSERELEIIIMIAEGYTNAQIADLLCLSAHTVNTHRRNIMAKLGVNNTAGLVMFAVKSELVSPNKFLFTAE
jgi:DNA-binding NarL/FixJ family response regulator